MTPPNDGLLTGERPPEGGSDRYTADYTLTTPAHPTARRRRRRTDRPSRSRPERRQGDHLHHRPLGQDLVFVGFAVITMHVSSTAADPTFIVCLQNVDPSGNSTLVTQDFVRASHRPPCQPCYSSNGTPGTSSNPADVANAGPLGPERTELPFALHPAAKRFAKSHRIRVTIAMADEGAVWVIPGSPRPEVTVWRDADHPSRLTLHQLPAERTEAAPVRVR